MYHILASIFTFVKQELLKEDIMRLEDHAKGGETTLERHGKEHFSQIGSRGGRTTAGKYGAEYYAEIGRKGAEKRWGAKKAIDTPSPKE